LRFAGEPVVFDRIYLVAELFNGLTLEALRGGERSLYSLFESDYGTGSTFMLELREGG